MLKMVFSCKISNPKIQLSFHWGLWSWKALWRHFPAVVHEMTDGRWILLSIQMDNRTKRMYPQIMGFRNCEFMNSNQYYVPFDNTKVIRMKSKPIWKKNVIDHWFPVLTAWAKLVQQICAQERRTTLFSIKAQVPGLQETGVVSLPIQTMHYYT